MKRREILLLPLAAAAASPAGARTIETSGTVLGLDPESQLLTLNTRVGRRPFVITSSTLFLLNNHSATQANVEVGDQAEVRYRYPSYEAVVVRLIREAKLRVQVTATSSNTISGATDQGAVVVFDTDSLSRLELEGIALTNRAVLVGRTARAIYEPESTTLLSLSASARLQRGNVSAVDAVARTVTLQGRQPLVFVMDANATIKRNGAFVAMSALVAGDRASLAWTPDGANRRGLALATRA